MYISYGVSSWISVAYLVVRVLFVFFRAVWCVPRALLSYHDFCSLICALKKLVQLLIYSFAILSSYWYSYVFVVYCHSALNCIKISQ